VIILEFNNNNIKPPPFRALLRDIEMSKREKKRLKKICGDNKFQIKITEMRITKKVEILFRRRQNNGIVKDARCSRFCHVNNSYTHAPHSPPPVERLHLTMSQLSSYCRFTFFGSLAHKKAIIQKLKVVNVRLINAAL
jgi:hypothetical protein